VKNRVLGIIEEPVAIENIEKNIIERGFRWIKPQIPLQRTGKTVAVIGSGPRISRSKKTGHTVMY
jgi:glutamate synthase (NADPH/NADH) small chain